MLFSSNGIRTMGNGDAWWPNREYMLALVMRAESGTSEGFTLDVPDDGFSGVMLGCASN